MPVFSKPIDLFFLLLSTNRLTGGVPVSLSSAAAKPVPAPIPRDIPEGIHYWPIDEDEKDRLSKMLNVDFRSLNVLGTFVTGPKARCEGCGKRSGLEDFVDNALKANIHTREWMVAVLREGKPNNSPPHELECSQCGSLFKRDDDHTFQWASGFNWVLKDSAEAEVAERAESKDISKRQEPVRRSTLQWASGFNWVLKDPANDVVESTGKIQRQEHAKRNVLQWASGFNWVLKDPSADTDTTKSADKPKRHAPKENSVLQWASGFNWVLKDPTVEGATSKEK